MLNSCNFQIENGDCFRECSKEEAPKIGFSLSNGDQFSLMMTRRKGPLVVWTKLKAHY